MFCQRECICFCHSEQSETFATDASRIVSIERPFQVGSASLELPTKRKILWRIPVEPGTAPSKGNKRRRRAALLFQRESQGAKSSAGAGIWVCCGGDDSSWILRGFYSDHTNPVIASLSCASTDAVGRVGESRRETGLQSRFGKWRVEMDSRNLCRVKH